MFKIVLISTGEIIDGFPGFYHAARALGELGVEGHIMKSKSKKKIEATYMYGNCATLYMKFF